MLNAILLNINFLATGCEFEVPSALSVHFRQLWCKLIHWHFIPLNIVDTILFKMLVDKLGKGRVVWRFDPMILTDIISIGDWLEKVKNIGDESQRIIPRNLCSVLPTSPRIVKWNPIWERMVSTILSGMKCQWMSLHQSCLKWTESADGTSELATCGEKIDIEQYGIEHNRCVDDDLMIRLAYQDKDLMDFLKVNIRRVNPLHHLCLRKFDDTPIIPADAIMLTPDIYAVKQKE